MNVDSTKSFLNDFKKITNPTTKAEIERVVLTVKKALAVKDIPNLRKMRGYKKGIYYRIRVGNYRIGVTVENSLVTFYAVGLRKDIYRRFP